MLRSVRIQRVDQDVSVDDPGLNRHRRRYPGDEVGQDRRDARRAIRGLRLCRRRALLQCSRSIAVPVGHPRTHHVFELRRSSGLPFHAKRRYSSELPLSSDYPGRQFYASLQDRAHVRGCCAAGEQCGPSCRIVSVIRIPVEDQRQMAEAILNPPAAASAFERPYSSIPISLAPRLSNSSPGQSCTPRRLYSSGPCSPSPASRPEFPAISSRESHRCPWGYRR
jgi:hypothetical protein